MLPAWHAPSVSSTTLPLNKHAVNLCACGRVMVCFLPPHMTEHPFGSQPRPNHYSCRMVWIHFFPLFDSSHTEENKGARSARYERAAPNTNMCIAFLLSEEAKYNHSISSQQPTAHHKMASYPLLHIRNGQGSFNPPPKTRISSHISRLLLSPS